MKIKTKIKIISPKKFACGPGKVKAEGKKASPPFCYKVKILRKKIKESHSMLKGRVTLIELHSKATGRKIGYIGTSPTMIVQKENDARQWVEGRLDPALKPFDTPDLIEKKMQHFIELAQRTEHSVPPGINPQYHDTTRKAWKLIIKAARS